MSDHFDTIHRWLEGIPRADAVALQQTLEYNSFINAFQRLEEAHRKIAMARSHNSVNAPMLQCISDDDVVLRICEFLDCLHLISLSETCRRFHRLCRKSAEQRISNMDGKFYLGSCMKVLRAKEQTQGIMPESISVRVPMLGLPRRVIVTDSGDPEFNGIYHCTGSNGNGYLFSKPRFDDNSMEISNHSSFRNAILTQRENLNYDGVQPRRRRRVEEIHGTLMVKSEDEDNIFPQSSSGRLLRCIICKKFSNQTLIWYMSKEVKTEDGQIKQEFFFWARLMMNGQGTPEMCRYPSQTSILQKDGNGAWFPLADNRSMRAPTVELFD
mmetsp:Transcript_5545/g.10554  ORF Transcript_5545/g.10554 Transcript_5545/m.10554 type:complete len:326 (-) Transcript_5545:1112-2089(-)